jgi:hypothetical protein
MRTTAASLALCALEQPHVAKNRPSLGRGQRARPPLVGPRVCGIMELPRHWWLICRRGIDLEAARNRLAPEIHYVWTSAG